MFGFSARAKRPLEPNKRKNKQTNKQEQASNKPGAARGHQNKNARRDDSAGHTS
jgi:hypothetical protein